MYIYICMYVCMYMYEFSEYGQIGRLGQGFAEQALIREVGNLGLGLMSFPLPGAWSNEVIGIPRV